MTAGYPTSVWDGDSGNRDSDDGDQAAPDHRDWDRAIAEVAAAQTQVNANQSGVAYPASIIHTVGVVATKSGLSVIEYGDAAVHKTVFTLAEMSTVSNLGGTPASDGAWGTQLLYTFPEGYIQILGAHIIVPIGLMVSGLQDGTGWKTAGDYEIGVGTVAAANATSFDLDGSTEEDIIAAITCALSSYISDAAESSQLTTVTAFDGTAGAKKLYLNYRASANTDFGDTVDDTLVFSGTFTILWSMLGDD